ncbi:MAG: hypothetical protein IJL04_00775 [Bacteroidales bacterium]|nr:hypothetical protein [Bacteroidales bacterium]MBQ6100807.1 hypothetical protein [Bacteroidales bacterium]
MKKFIYLCILTLLCLRAMAQIDPYDNNWDTLVHDEFTNNSWNTWNEWKISHPKGLSNYQPSVKKSITITPTNMLTVPINSNINMRAVDSIVINKNFVLPQGAQITLQTQMCPE